MNPEKTPEWQPIPIHIDVPPPIEIPSDDKKIEKPVKRNFVINGDDPREDDRFEDKIKNDDEM